MLKSWLRDQAVKSFSLVARAGVHRTPPFDRLFLALYDLYKLHFEAGPIDRLRDFVPSGSLVIDVGANVGFFSVRFADWIGPEGRVIAIEPEEENNRNLVNTLARAKLLDRVDVVTAVAADTSGMAALEINPLHPADHKLSRDGTGVAVKSVTLDELVGNYPMKPPSLIKIDVQGAEMLVLGGAARILAESRPVLFVELHEDGLKRFNTSVAAIVAYLSRYGYGTYWLSKDGPHRRSTEEEIHAQIARVGYADALFVAADSVP
jgi:FkbM family methyltransferase